MIDQQSDLFRFYEQLRMWLEQEFSILTSFEEESEKMRIVFSHSGQKLALLFKPHVEDAAYITASLRFSNSTYTMLQRTDISVREKIQKDLLYEISGFSVPFSTENDDDIIQGISFVQPYYDSRISKNSFIDKVNAVYNAHFRTKLYMSKTY